MSMAPNNFHCEPGKDLNDSKQSQPNKNSKLV